MKVRIDDKNGIAYIKPDNSGHDRFYILPDGSSILQSEIEDKMNKIKISLILTNLREEEKKK